MARMLGVAPAPPAAMGARPALHLYHLGAVDFFSDHEELALTQDQRANLSGIRETAISGYASAQRQIDQAEQDLWSLTSPGRPDARQVEAKLMEIGRLAAQQRLEYIRAVGHAVAQLTDAQQKLALSPTSVKGSPMSVGSGSNAASMTRHASVAPTSGSGMPMAPMEAPSAPSVDAGDAGDAGDGAVPMGHM